MWFSEKQKKILKFSLDIGLDDQKLPYLWTNKKREKRNIFHKSDIRYKS